MTQSYVHPEYLVETDWLARHLSDPQVVAIDMTTHLIPKPNNVLYDPKPGREDFERAHIPGAQFADIERDLSDHSSNLHFMLPSAAQFGEAMGRLGVSNDSLVVAYSTANHWWATRLWWMLRVFGHERAAVLNGGFQKWQREGRSVESGPAKPRPAARFVATYQPGHVVGKQEMLAATGNPDICTVNALRPEQHNGTGGTNYGRLGHISGSINIAAVNHVGADNCYKSAGELRAMFAAALASPRVMTYCGGGIAATSVALVLAMFGKENVQVYDASLGEWAQDPHLPMER
ncbi:MAG: sulfurtransferase [Burkholderiales bacterium]